MSRFVSPCLMSSSLDYLIINYNAGYREAWHTVGELLNSKDM